MRRPRINLAATPRGFAGVKPADAASLARIRGGKAAQRSGDWFEKVIRSSASDEGGEIIELEDLPKCGARFTGKMQAHPLPIACDFIGSVVGPGLGVFFDAKSCGVDAYGIELNNDKILKPHQADFLYRQSRAGAIAGLLVECRKLGDYRWLDGSHLGPGRAYCAWHDERWLKLGEATRRIRFRVLVETYLGKGGVG